MIKKLFLLILFLLVGLVGIIGYNTVTNTPADPPNIAYSPPEIDKMAAAERLSGAVQIKTISISREAPVAAQEFEDLHEYIEAHYPNVASQLTKTRISNYSILYKWEGRDPTLPAAIFMGHMDVVPVEPGTESKWEYPPFSGKLADGAIWGRGTLDDKVSVFAILEAAEHHLKSGLKPKHTIYFAFGHDEEIGGENGAAKIASHLKEQGVKVAYTLDEGMVVVQGIMPGIEDPIAFIALAEKGYLTLELVATADGGHSSMPPRKTAVGKLARAVSRIEQHRLPASMRRPVTDMFDTLSPHMPLSLKAVISNRWLLDPILISQLGKGGATNAMVRTTTAATIFNSGTKDNVLPTKATAIVNFRLLPGDSIQSVIDHVTNAVDDPEVEIRIKQGNEPSKVSEHNNSSYGQIKKTIHEVFPDVLVSPGLMLAGSDSKHYEELAENSYRFLPLRFGKEDLGRVHGTNERILIDNYAEIIQFYIRLMENSGN
ncbi:M20 family peptidase [Sneathiella glossodoripedis]|uniref:M20 family peptidase n=1 Tax=Sneathiella glossodoripedis TaxID=418853 RepID=UPI0004707879|nr:M20 family peptidase [Sneathiella glossodoripedis]